MKLGLLKPPQTSPRSIGLTEHTLDMDLLPKAALWESSHAVTLLWDYETQWGYRVFLPRSGPGNTSIGSGSECPPPSSATAGTVHWNLYFLSLFSNFPHPQPRVPLSREDGGRGAWCG